MASELGEDKYHSGDAAICGEFYLFFFYCICVMSIFIILEDANSPVPVSGNEAHREGSLLMTGGELRADKVRDVLST